MSEVYSSVHSHTFPAISYIPCLLNVSLAPVDNTTLLFESFFPYAPLVHPESFGAYFEFSFVIFRKLFA